MWVTGDAAAGTVVEVRMLVVGVVAAVVVGTLGCLA